MTDVEAREKKRVPPPKLQPIKVGQLKDKEAYLADYFGEASLPFTAPSAVIRPPKRPIYSKSKSVSSNSLVNTINSANSNSNSNVDAATDSNRDSSDPIQLSTSMPAATSYPTLISDQGSTLENHISVPYSVGTNGSSTQSDPPLLQRLRSSSRLAEQDSLHRKHSSSMSDPRNPVVEEPTDVSSDPKPTFVVPQPKLFRNPSGKENHLPQTPISSRSKNLKPITKTGPRKSFNWGRPHRGDAPDPDDLEESKTLATSDGSIPTGTDVQSDQEKRESPTALVTRSSGSFSPDSSLQELPMDDLSVSQTRGRQGSNRDYDESVSVTKKMRPDIDASSIDRVEFSPQLVTQHTEVNAINTFTVPTSKIISAPQSLNVPAQSVEPQKELIGAKITLRPQSSTVIMDNRKRDGETIAAPPQTSQPPTTSQSVDAPPGSPQLSRPPQLPTASQSIGAPYQKALSQSSHAEGIASIAQHLAVGSVKAPAMPRPFSGQTDLNSRSGPVGTQRQLGSAASSGMNSTQSTGRVGSTIPATSVPVTAVMTMAPSAISMPAAPGRAELGARQVMMVNNRPYTKLAQVGKGGSSKVYKVLASNSRIFALKKVSFEKAEQLMEYGEIDLAHMLLNQREQPFDIHFIGLYWRQMLEAVQVIHDEKIVHSDLKPANFLLVEGSLKLIDFGIANAIANDTTNIHREGQLGTANYMSPEAIGTNPTAVECRKLGRASDVWSLGCILYQMVYGKTPFSDILNVFKKLNVITNPNHRIEFPETVLSPLQPRRVTSLAPIPTENGDPAAISRAIGSSEGASSTGATRPEINGSVALPPPVITKTAKVDPDLIRIMRGCLTFQAKDRMNIPELLVDQFLHRN
ncbi:Dual-specificity kinase, spindle pole body (SPB) duplication and spindle checkpoint function [Mortierella sp. AM989]|nr:Dual-specificity kinase, spindle pole body (SPB) duplication and spindle checkpoint function [Mortierella sp. AM989]